MQDTGRGRYDAQAIASGRFGNHLDSLFALTSVLAVKTCDDLASYFLQLNDDINAAQFNNYICILALSKGDLISMFLSTNELTLNRYF